MASKIQNKTRRAGSILGAVTLMMLLFGTVWGQGTANSRLTPPRSHLGPSNDSPIYLGFHAQVGGASEFDSGLLGYGSELVFRPGAAADFLSFLYSWNAGLCMQIDYQNVSDNESILSGDFIVRKYVTDMRDPLNTKSAFFGVGFGASRVILPPGSAGSKNKFWSLVGEVGHEWTVGEKWLFWVKGQYRYYNYSGYNYSYWAMQTGVGIPLPW